MTDETLRLALEEYNEVLLASLPEPSKCTHAFSPRFQRKMRSVCRLAKHPVAYPALKRAACIVLALLALLGGVMAFNTQARAAVLDWIKETFGQGTRYSYQGEQQLPSIEDKKRYELSWILEGYTLWVSDESELSGMTIYTGPSNEMLVWMCIYKVEEYSKEQAVSLYIDSSHCNIKKVAFQNGTADIYLERRPGKNNAIVWTNVEGNVLFYIAAPCGEAELIKLAESVTEKP